jgi:hypothetical protein
MNAVKIAELNKTLEETQEKLNALELTLKLEDNYDFFEDMRLQVKKELEDTISRINADIVKASMEMAVIDFEGDEDEDDFDSDLFSQIEQTALNSMFAAEEDKVLYKAMIARSNEILTKKAIKSKENLSKSDSFIEEFEFIFLKTEGAYFSLDNICGLMDVDANKVRIEIFSRMKQETRKWIIESICKNFKFMQELAIGLSELEKIDEIANSRKFIYSFNDDDNELDEVFDVIPQQKSGAIMIHS